MASSSAVITDRFARVREPQHGRVRVRAVLYARVSHDPNGNGRSVSEQLAEGNKVILREDWDCVAVYQDNDASASEYTSDVRPEWEKLIVALNAGQFDVLVVWEPSRATRDRQAWAALAYACEVHNVKICANGKVYDLADPDEAFALDLFFALSRRESAATRKRVQRTMNASADAGRPGPGKAPFGYRRVRDKATGAVTGYEFDDKVRETIHEKDGRKVTTQWNPADEVRKMYADILAGVSAYAIAERLNTLGIPNPRTIHAMEHHPERERSYSSVWSSGMIRSLLVNKVYLGQRTHRGKTTAEDKWPTLVDKETFYAILNERARLKDFPGRTPRPASARHLLSRIVLCDHCDLPIQATSQNDTDAYRCRTGRLYVDENELDKTVTSFVLRWLADPMNLEKIQRNATSAEEVALARGEIERLRAELAQVKDAFNEGMVDLDDYVGRRSKLLPKIEAAEHTARTSGLPPALRGIAGQNPGQVWQGLELSARREIVRSLVEVRVAPGGRGACVPIGERIKFKVIVGADA